MSEAMAVASVMLPEMVELINLYEVRERWSNAMEVPLWTFTVLASGMMRRTWLVQNQ